jgi:hypothetical protein
VLGDIGSWIGGKFGDLDLGGGGGETDLGTNVDPDGWGLTID